MILDTNLGGKSPLLERCSMKRKRRSFTTEFKDDSAALVLDQGYTIAEVSRSLDVGKSALRRWVDQLRSERGGIMPKSQVMTPEQQRIQELERRVRELETEKCVRKKAMVSSTDQCISISFSFSKGDKYPNVFSAAGLAF